MAVAARNVRSQSKYAGTSMTPLAGQDFLDFFGRGEKSPRLDKRGFGSKATARAPEGLKKYAPSFIPQAIERPVFEQQLDLDDPFQIRRQTGTVADNENLHEVSRRTGGPGTDRRDNPVWKQAYDAALIQFNKGADARRADEAKRKQQREGRKEREDRAVGGGVGSPSGTTLITGAQGFLGGQGSGTSSLLK